MKIRTDFWEKNVKEYKKLIELLVRGWMIMSMINLIYSIISGSAVISFINGAVVLLTWIIQVSKIRYDNSNMEVKKYESNEEIKGKVVNRNDKKD